MGFNHNGTTISIIVFVLVLACLEFDFQFVYGGETLSVGCVEQERESLLSFKQDLIDDGGLLSSWGSHNECCEWEGVGCSNTTGHVTTLRLNPVLLRGDNFYIYGLRGKINSALLELHHLNTLDLSQNDFGGIRIPDFIGSIKTLQKLYLISSNFTGSIPVQLGNLTNLRTLSLSYLQSDNLHWLSHLSMLSNLHFSNSIISDANWLQHVLMLPSLQRLYLRWCMLPDVTKSLFVYNSSSATTSLSVLDLRYNDLTSSTVDWLFNVSLSSVTFNFLKELGLSGNMLQGGIPKSFRNLSHLQYLYLSDNVLGESIEELLGKLPCTQMVSLALSNCQLTGSVPTYLGQCSKLESLDLSHNSLEGIVSEAHFVKHHNLVHLRLSFNSLTLDLSPGWIPPFRLAEVGLASCKMGPSFPTWFQTQRNLEWLDLSSNLISDEVPKWFWNLSTYNVYLNLSHNQMSGTIPKLSSQTTDISFNKFSGPMPQFPLDPQLPVISVVQLSQNKFSGSISWMCKLSFNMFSLSLIDLSYNQLEGALPNCWENMTSLEILNFNNNNFSGEIPPSLGNLQNLKTLQLRGNTFSGELPPPLKNCQNLQMIDIGDNEISGSIPSWLGENYKNMAYLSLRKNRFYGGIPPEICQLTQVQMLDLSRNNLSGKIPQCFDKFTSLVYKNRTRTSSITILYRSFYINYALVIWKGTRNSISILSSGFYINYALVQWKGQDLAYGKTLGLLKLIDLSSNKLVGSIPKAFSSLRGLILLNLSRNSLTGKIDPNIGEMDMLECLDLSRNHLMGEIPTGLAQLNYLDVLDLAYNNLSGKIPSSTQLQSFNESVFAGNYDLCGKPLKLCPEDGLRPSSSSEGENIEEKDGGFWNLSFVQEFGISMGFGFIVGFWGLVGSMILKSSWRSSYFNFLDVVGNWLHESTAILFPKFRRN